MQWWMPLISSYPNADSKGHYDAHSKVRQHRADLKLIWYTNDTSLQSGILILTPPVHDLTFVQAEHVFKFWITGVSTAGILDHKEDAKFSDNWGISTVDYIKSVNKLTPRQSKKIKDTATELMEKPKLSVSLTQGANASPLDT